MRYRARLRDLGHFLRFLQNRGLIEQNPAEGIELPKLGSPLPESLTIDEAERVLAMAQRIKYAYKFEAKRNAAIIALMLFSGIRKGELLRLKMSDVNLERMTLSIIQGKGKKDRLLPISTKLATFLSDYVIDRTRLQKTGEAFFVTTQGNTPIAATCIKRLVERIRKGTGIYFTPHTLRHAFATLMLEGGCDLYTLSKLMGHTKISTTAVYLACTPRMMANSMERHPMN